MLPMAEACAPASTAAGSSDSSTRSQHDGEQLRNLRCLVPAGAGTANPTIIRDYARWLANYRLLFSSLSEPLCCTSFALLAVRSSSIKISVQGQIRPTRHLVNLHVSQPLPGEGGSGCENHEKPRNDRRSSGVAAAKPDWAESGRSLTCHARPRSLRPFISREAAAAYVCVSPNTFDEMMKDGRMPRPKVLGLRRHAWDVRSLDDAIDRLPTEGDDAPRRQHRPDDFETHAEALQPCRAGNTRGGVERWLGFRPAAKGHSALAGEDEDLVRAPVSALDMEGVQKFSCRLTHRHDAESRPWFARRLRNDRPLITRSAAMSVREASGLNLQAPVSYVLARSNRRFGRCILNG
jgi:predicted DNA-binding transcriptional regulator AlpA